MSSKTTTTTSKTSKTSKTPQQLGKELAKELAKVSKAPQKATKAPQKDKAEAKALTSAARQEAISGLVGETLNSHQKPSDLVRIEKGSYELKLSPKAKPVKITQGTDGWSVSTLQGKTYSTRGEAYLAARKALPVS